MDSCSEQRSRPVTARIQAACQGFSASLNAMLPFLRKQESSMWMRRHGFLLSQEWYGGIPVFAGVEAPAWIPAFAGMVRGNSCFRRSGGAGMDSCLRRNGTGEFLFSQEWRCRHGFLFRAEIASGDSADPGCPSGVFCVIECYVTIPAQAGIQYVEVPAWIPACAGMVRGNSCFRRSGGAGMDSCFRRNGTGEFLFSQEWRRRHGFLLSQEWYGGIPVFAGVEVPAWIPAFAGMVRGNSCFRRSGGAGMDSCSGRRSRPVTARIQAACQGFSASLNAILPFLRKQESSMWRYRHGFLLSQEWYGGIPVSVGMVRGGT